MTNFYDVYDNITDKIVYCGTWEDVEDYAECEGRYTIVKREVNKNEMY